MGLRPWKNTYPMLQTWQTRPRKSLKACGFMCRWLSKTTNKPTPLQSEQVIQMARQYAAPLSPAGRAGMLQQGGILTRRSRLWSVKVEHTAPYLILRSESSLKLRLRTFLCPTGSRSFPAGARDNDFLALCDRASDEYTVCGEFQLVFSGFHTLCESPLGTQAFRSAVSTHKLGVDWHSL